VIARVLVVDDEPDVEALFRQQFRREVRQGLYRLDFALSGEVALNKLDEDCAGGEIILLVSDINMPGMSGLELLLKVKARRPELPVFVISAYGDPERVRLACERGASKFITKPVDFLHLKQEVSAIVAGAYAPSPRPPPARGGGVYGLG
jgi:DNA-binding NtrC family response regulator